MIGPFIDMRGSVDVHVHSEPDVFPRIADDVGVARHAAALGLRAISLKCHSERTTSRAYMAQQMVPGIQVVGGIVLNRSVGGINPAAVESALQLGEIGPENVLRERSLERLAIALDVGGSRIKGWERHVGDTKEDPLGGIGSLSGPKRAIGGGKHERAQWRTFS